MSEPSAEFPPYLFLFGLSGAGKNHCARILSSEFGYTDYDLDQDLTPAFKDAISNRKILSTADREEYFSRIVDRIKELKSLHARVVFHQAAYKDYLRQRIVSFHPDLIFIWIDAPSEIIENRQRGSAESVEYAKLIQKEFEAPRGGPRLLNDVNDDKILLRRFSELFK